MLSPGRELAPVAIVEIPLLPQPGTTFAMNAGGPWPAVSPDGRHVAFVALTNDAQQLWVRSLHSAVSRPIQGTEGAFRPFWSPDSQSIAFFANGELRRVSLTGGGVPDATLSDRFERIITGLARQLRSTLERDPERGRYSVRINLVGKREA